MDKTILNKYKNPDEKLILSKIFDKINFCETRNQIQVTDFLDLAQQALIEKVLKLQKQENYIFFGGHDNAERKVIIFYPEKFSDLIKAERIDIGEWIKVLRIILPNENKGKYDHKIYLGGLMKLGIKREKIGDILVDQNGADILISNDIMKFLQNNILQLTRFQKSKLDEINLKDLKEINIENEIIKITVSSMRLDNIIAELARCSRNKALDIIEQERVFVNFQLVTKQTKEIKENDKITIRGKGRFEIKEIIGNTKKGRYLILVEK